MGNTKAGDGLNGAFYGPAVPPPTGRRRHTSRSIGRGVGTSCCGCLLCTLLQIVFTIVVILGLIILVLWLVFRPNKIKVNVENATLSRFDLNSTSNSSRLLSYDLSLDVSIRNPNKRISIYYDYLEASAVYDGYRFGYDNTLPVFYQDHKNTTTIYPKFEGQTAMVTSSTLETYSGQKEDGTFKVELKLYARIRLKVWFIKSNKYKPKARCELKLPVPGSRSGTFTRTKCDVDLF